MGSGARGPGRNSGSATSQYGDSWQSTYSPYFGFLISKTGIIKLSRRVIGKIKRVTVPANRKHSINTRGEQHSRLLQGGIKMSHRLVYTPPSNGWGLGFLPWMQVGSAATLPGGSALSMAGPSRQKLAASSSCLTFSLATPRCPVSSVTVLRPSRRRTTC